MIISPKETSLDQTGRRLSSDELEQLSKATRLLGLVLTDCPIGDNEIARLKGLSRLVNLSLQGTKITDAALKTLATLPSLRLLFLSRTAIRGTGLAHLSGHKSLETLALDDTKVDDATVAALVKVPRLSSVRLAGTRVTREGLLKLAVHPKLRIFVGPPLTGEDVDAFEKAQREAGRAKRAKGTRAKRETIAPEQTLPGKALVAFFQEMIAWERWLGRQREGAVASREAEVRCRKIFKRLCTTRKRVQGRPGAIFFSRPPAYLDQRLVDYEVLSAKKVRIITMGSDRYQHRFTLLEKGGAWKVDQREDFMDGWSAASL